MPAIGLHLIAAGVASALAFVLWWPLGIVTVLLLANAARVFAFPPLVARVDPLGVRLGGPMTVKAVRVGWKTVEGVSVDGTRMFLERGDAGTLAFPLAYVGGGAQELVRDVYERLNAANGYRRFDPSNG